MRTIGRRRRRLRRARTRPCRRLHRDGACGRPAWSRTGGNWYLAAAAAVGAHRGDRVRPRRCSANRATTIDSVAVLPFSMAAGGAEETEYLTDGLTETLINGLAQLPNLRVSARSVVFRYKGTGNVDAQQVGQTLGVTAVVTGRVAVRGDRLVIQTELMDVDTGTQLWGGQYNRPQTDLLAVQEEIAEEILETLQPRISGEERRRVTRRYTENAEAFQLYLQGRYHWNKGTIEGYKRAIDYFQQAIGKDPKYALAYAGLAGLVPAARVVLGRDASGGQGGGRTGARHRQLAVRGARRARQHQASARLGLAGRRARVPAGAVAQSELRARAQPVRELPGDRRTSGRRAQPGPPRAGTGSALADRQQRPRALSALRRTG